MRERWTLQVVVLLLVLSLTGCQLLAVPLQFIQSLVPYLLGLFTKLAPLAAIVQVDPLSKPADAAVVRAVEHPEQLPVLRRESLVRMVREQGARSVVMIDLRHKSARQIQQLLKRFRAVPDSKLMIADASQLVGSPEAQRVLVEALQRQSVRLLDDGSLEASPNRSMDADYRSWRKWLDEELSSR